MALGSVNGISSRIIDLIPEFTGVLVSGLRFRLLGVRVRVWGLRFRVVGS